VGLKSNRLGLGLGLGQTESICDLFGESKLEFCGEHADLVRRVSPSLDQCPYSRHIAQVAIRRGRLVILEFERVNQ
jgi:hypothetical protein